MNDFRFVALEDLVALAASSNAERLAYGTDAPQFGELWMPHGRGTFPVVLLVHGGCWSSHFPGLELVRPLAEALVARALAVWNIEYRRLGDPGGGYPGTFRDVAAAADMLRSLADRYPLDLARTVAVGHSAGGHLALWLAGRRRIKRDSLLWQPDPVALRRAISLGGLGDLKTMHQYAGAYVCGETTIPSLIDLPGRGEDAYSDTSPIRLLPLGTPQTMIVGVFDSALPPFFSSTYHDAALAEERTSRSLPFKMRRILM